MGLALSVPLLKDFCGQITRTFILIFCFPKFFVEKKMVSQNPLDGSLDGTGLSRTITVVQMHVWLSFVSFCICVLNSLNRVVESFFENFLKMTDWSPRHQNPGPKLTRSGTVRHFVSSFSLSGRSQRSLYVQSSSHTCCSIAPFGALDFGSGTKRQ